MSAASSHTELNPAAAAHSTLERIWLPLIGLAFVFVLAFTNLVDFPLTWFDEGSHLHVPKTLVRFGVYADYSRDGFRYFGPTIGVGPTVMLPIAAAFKLFGIGLFQARVIMALYLVGAVIVFYGLARLLGGPRLALVATALLVVTPGLGLVEYGRQVLGEVPGLLFTLAGFWVWFKAWDSASLRRLTIVGLFFGLAVVTKNQYLLVLAPTLLFAWLANLYYNSAPQRVFLVPGILTAMVYAIWQVYVVIFLGPSTAAENLTILREATSGAALVFSTDLMRRGIEELLSLKVYFGLLIPTLLYGGFLALPRNRAGHQWGVLLALAVVNLVWYVTASISWLRYAFPALAIASLFVARFMQDLTADFQVDLPAFSRALRTREWTLPAATAWRTVWLAWLALMILAPLGKLALDVFRPPDNGPLAMAQYMREHVPAEAWVETWEPEMGFLTDHDYNFPPPSLLPKAVSYIWQGGQPPSDFYAFAATEPPPYVLVGEFARWVELYPEDELAARYDRVTAIGVYELYELRR